MKVLSYSDYGEYKVAPPNQFILKKVSQLEVHDVRIA